MGLSPRVRGSRGRRARNSRRSGPIPAGAGEPSCAGLAELGERAYPRGCGGAELSAQRKTHGRGLSPRVRGSLFRDQIGERLSGPIPAGAGEPLDHRRAGHAPGLSPRVRGSLGRLDVARDDRGPIPAGAGEPSTTCPATWPIWAYPRGCGGARLRPVSLAVNWGLSPRVRGSRVPPSPSSFSKGPIPAGAGEPVHDPASPRLRRAYPRGCGGAPGILLHPERTGGLSPRVRGSQPLCRRRQPGDGPIPAGAGEPSASGGCATPPRAYPRGCGGALQGPPSHADLRGLSPRVRGSLVRSRLAPSGEGPIPAGAGEPRQNHAARR